jgi:hypothetical protein
VLFHIFAGEENFSFFTERVNDLDCGGRGDREREVLLCLAWRICMRKNTSIHRIIDADGCGLWMVIVCCPLLYVNSNCSAVVISNLGLSFHFLHPPPSSFVDL